MSPPDCTHNAEVAKSCGGEPAAVAPTLAAGEVSALKEALSLYTAVGVGQFEALYWDVLRTGRVRQASGERLTDAQCETIQQHLEGIKAVLGLPADECFGLNHPGIDWSIKQAAALEARIAQR